MDKIILKGQAADAFVRAAIAANEPPVALQRLVSCPLCNSTDVTRLWRVEIVLPGDNSDNSTKAWRYACNACRASEWIERERAANNKVSYHADNAGGAHGKDTNDK